MVGAGRWHLRIRAQAGSRYVRAITELGAVDYTSLHRWSPVFLRCQQGGEKGFRREHFESFDETRRR
jgi:hypothetical protein